MIYCYDTNQCGTCTEPYALQCPSSIYSTLARTCVNTTVTNRVQPGVYNGVQFQIIAQWTIPATGPNYYQIIANSSATMMNQTGLVGDVLGFQGNQHEQRNLNRRNSRLSMRRSNHQRGYIYMLDRQSVEQRHQLPLSASSDSHPGRSDGAQRFLPSCRVFQRRRNRHSEQCELLDVDNPPGRLRHSMDRNRGSHVRQCEHHATVRGQRLSDWYVSIRKSLSSHATLLFV